MTEAITREIYFDCWAMKKVEEKRCIRYQPDVSCAWCLRYTLIVGQCRRLKKNAVLGTSLMFQVLGEPKVMIEAVRREISLYLWR